MERHYTLGIYDYDREKICDLYDSQIELIGQAYDITVSKEIEGYNTLEFSLPYMIEQEPGGKPEQNRSRFGSAVFGYSRFEPEDLAVLDTGKNFRWNYLKSDYLIRYSCDGTNIWFVANKPKKSKSGKQIVGEVTCSGFEELLKTRNIYQTFDDENGIGTIQYIMEQILTGTGWHYNERQSDTLYERDGTTEKIRSLKSDGKEGALGLITTACNLFQARPIFDTDEMLVTIKAMKNRQQVLEGEVGRNLSALSVNHDSSNICTRVYVEGEYGDYGYVGIDDVEVDGEPYGLPFLVNFDYYRSLGVFKNTHEEALATYLHDIREKKAQIREAEGELIECEDELNRLIGQCDLAVYYKNESLVTPVYIYGYPTSEQAALAVGDEVVILKNDNTHTYEEWTGIPGTQLADAYGVAKFVTKAAGIIGSMEVQIEAKEKSITQLEAKIASTVKPDKIAEYEAEIAQLEDEIEEIYDGDEETDGMYALMSSVMKSDGLLHDKSELEDEVNTLNEEQDEIEATFIAAMGYMLRDGYWSNQNYAAGQEEYLYADALDMSEEMSKPTTEYSFDYVRVVEEFDIPTEDIDVNSVFKLYDRELQVDDKMFVKKVTYGVDNKSLGKIEVSNQDITLTGNDLGSLLSRMSQLADLIEQKNALYERAKALTSDGSLYTDRLNGQIDVLKTQLLSTVSNWHTDDRGNIVFISADGGSAMMLGGAGFMIADGKTDSGDWNWRSFGTGRGFTADEITAGFISVDRLESGSISTAKVTADFGDTLSIENNSTITGIDAAIELNGQAIEAEVSRATGVEAGLTSKTQYLQSDGKITINAFTTSSAQQVATTAGITLDADGKVLLSAADFDSIGNSSGVLLEPDKITVGSTGDIDFSAANSLSLKGGSVALTALASTDLSDYNFDSLGDNATGIYLTPTTVKINSTGTFQLDSTNLTVGTDGTVTASALALNGGSITLKDNGTTKFSVSSAGYLTSVSGNIAGWEISNTSLTGNKTGMAKTTNDTDVAFWAGNATASSAPFKVTQGGALTATNATITGAIQSGSTISGSTITGGSINIANGTFEVDSSGNLTATSASITGTVTASGGKIGNWTIGTDSLYSGSGTSYVALNSKPTDTYAIWAGSDTAASAKFRVARDGTTYLTKLVCIDEHDVQTTVDLTNYPFWKLWYSTIKEATVTTDTQGYCTSFQMSNGTTLNFNRATTLSGSWSGNTYTVTSGTASISTTVDVNATTYSGQYSDTFLVSASTYTGYGWDDHATKTGTLTTSGSTSSTKVNVNINNVKVGEISVGSLYTDGYTSAKIAKSWSGDTCTLTKSTTGSDSISLQVQAGATYDSTNHCYNVSAYCDSGTRYTTTTGTEAYSAGSTAGYTSAKVSKSWSGTTCTISKSSSGSNSVTVTVGAGIAYNSSTHKYTASAYADSATRDSTTSGLEAYNAGYNDALADAGVPNGGWVYTASGWKQTMWDAPVSGANQYYNCTYGSTGHELTKK